MSAELEAVTRSVRAIEDRLGVLHEQAAVLRDTAPPSSRLKSNARRIANCIEGALQRLEKIE